MKRRTLVLIIASCLLSFLGWKLNGALPLSEESEYADETILTGMTDGEMEQTLKLLRAYKESKWISYSKNAEKDRRRANLNRDPFAIPDTERRWSAATRRSTDRASWPLAVSGILWDEVAPGAIINGKVVTVNTRIAGYRVTAIHPQSVVLSTGSKRVVLRLPRRTQR